MDRTASAAGQAVDQVRAMTGRFDVPVEEMRAAGAAALTERADHRPSGSNVP